MINTKLVIEYNKNIYKHNDLVEVLTIDWCRIRGRVTTISDEFITLDISTALQRKTKKFDIYHIRSIKKFNWEVIT